MFDLFSYITGVLFFSWVLWLPVLLVLTLLTPKKLLDKYFKEPHFNTGEVVVLGSFPGFIMRTSMFFRFYLTPKSVSGRNLEGFVEDSPKWYRYSVLIIISAALVHGLFAFLSGGVIAIIS